jgi:hypothetical protein
MLSSRQARPVSMPETSGNELAHADRASIQTTGDSDRLHLVLLSLMIINRGSLQRAC